MSSNLLHMDLILPTTALTVTLACIVLLVTIVLTLQKIIKNVKKSQAEREMKILQEAKEEDQIIRSELESKIEQMDSQLKNLELSINKDMAHLKENYSAEVKVLGEKIEALREELRGSNSEMIQLLSKLIESKNN